MLSTDYTLTEFVIVFEATSPEEVEDFHYWTDVDDVAKISEQDLAKYGPYREKARRRDEQDSTETKTGPNLKRKPSVRFDLTIKSPTKPKHSTTQSRDRSSLPKQSLLKPLKTILEPNSSQIPKKAPVDRQTPTKITNGIGNGDNDITINNNTGHNDHDYQHQQQHEQQQSSGNKSQSQLSAEDIRLNKELLADLIPPDIDTIDLNSDKIYVSMLNDGDSDSVSFVGSGNSDEDGD